MLRESDVLELITLIYDAALQPSGWPAFLEKFADAVCGVNTSIILYDIEHHSGSLATTVRFDPELKRKYDEYYAGVDCWGLNGGHLVTTGQVVTGQMLCADPIVKRSEFYSDFLLPL